MKRTHFMVIILTIVMIAGFAAMAEASDQPGDSPMEAPKPMLMEGSKAMSMKGPKAMEQMIAESQVRPMAILVKVSGKSPEQVKMLVMHKGIWAAAQQLRATDALVMAMVQKRFEMIDFLVAKNKIGLKQSLLVKMALLRRVMMLVSDKQMGQGMMGGMMSKTGCKCQMMESDGSGMMGKGMGDGAKAGEGKMGGMEMPGDCKGQAKETEATESPEAAKPETAKPETAVPVAAPEHQH